MSNEDLLNSMRSWLKIPASYNSLNHHGYYDNKKVNEISVPEEEEVEDTGTEKDEEVVDTSGEENEEVSDTSGDMSGDVSGEVAGSEDMDGEEEGVIPLDKLSRMHALKNIYNKLLFLEEQLAIEYATEVQEVKSSIAEALSMFKIIIDNLDAYEDKLDEIIKTYYKLITNICNNLTQYYKKNRGT